MSDSTNGTSGASGANEQREGSVPDDDAMRALLKRSIEAAAPAMPEKPELLRGVQRKIRQRSRGKFFADGWSTSQSRVSYALVAAIMLVIIAVAYFAMGPTGFSR